MRAIALLGILAFSASAQASELVVNGDFSTASPGATITAQHEAGPAAAAGWQLWNNSDAITASQLVDSFAGRNSVLHITTTGALNGAFQYFSPLAKTGFADIWVESGQATYLAALDGASLQSAATSTTGAWEHLALNFDADAFDEVALYSLGGSADFYVSDASAAAAVPEPATWAMMIAGFGAIGFAARRRHSVRQARLA